MAIPKDKKLYNKVKQSAIKKFDVYPSAYANAWVVKEYKRLGGKYIGKKSQVFSKSVAKVHKNVIKKKSNKKRTSRKKQ